MRRGVHLLGVETERCRELDEGLEALDRLGHASGRGERLHEPERAREERALTTGQAVATRRVPVEERTTGAELAGDRVDRPLDPR
ncbi:MAG TPA: hypothetical protein VJT16_07110 [Streptosporangiaceae bacterium]|nr:hypothetical protein [Streptosporangiaceae bacterium]